MKEAPRNLVLIGGTGLPRKPDGVVSAGGAKPPATEGLQFVKPGIEVKASEATNVAAKNPAPAKIAEQASSGKGE